MAFFDRKVSLGTSAADVWRLLQEMTASHKAIISKENTLLLTADDEYGYLYVLREMPDGTLNLRHVLDTYTHVKEVFRSARGQEALKLLMQPTTDVDEATSFFAKQEAEDRLQEIVKKLTPQPVSKASSQPNLKTFLQDKPTQRDSTWGSTVDDLPVEEGKFKAGIPWDPRRLSSYMFFISTVGVGVGLGINWRRLGKPEWTWWTILLAIVMPFLTIGIVLLMVNRVTISPLAGMALAMLGAGLNFGVMYAIVYLQHGAYKKWQAVGHTAALKAHHYDFINATLIALGIAILAVVGGTGYAYYQSIPQQFSDSHISLTYPKSWGQSPASAYGDFCDDYGCEVILSESQFRYTHMLFVRVPLRREETAQEYESDTWDYVSSQYNVTFLDEQTMTIDGREAVVLEFEQSQRNDDPLHVMRIFIADGNTMLSITAYSENTGIFNERRRDIEAVLSSIHFNENGA